MEKVKTAAVSLFSTRVGTSRVQRHCNAADCPNTLSPKCTSQQQQHYRRPLLKRRELWISLWRTATAQEHFRHFLLSCLLASSSSSSSRSCCSSFRPRQTDWSPVRQLTTSCEPSSDVPSNFASCTLPWLYRHRYLASLTDWLGQLHHCTPCLSHTYSLKRNTITNASIVLVAIVVQITGTGGLSNNTHRPPLPSTATAAAATRSPSQRRRPSPLPTNQPTNQQQLWHYVNMRKRRVEELDDLDWWC